MKCNGDQSRDVIVTTQEEQLTEIIRINQVKVGNENRRTEDDQRFLAS